MDTSPTLEVTVDTWPAIRSHGLELPTTSGPVLVHHHDPAALRDELGPGSRLVLSPRPDGSYDVVEHVPGHASFTIADLLE